MAGGAGANRARQMHNENSGQSQQPKHQRNMRGHGGPAPYDGPASQPSSQHGDQPRQNPFPPGPGYDPAKPAAAKPSIIMNTRVELPVAAYALDTNGVSFTFSQASRFKGYVLDSTAISF